MALIVAPVDGNVCREGEIQKYFLFCAMELCQNCVILTIAIRLRKCILMRAGLIVGDYDNRRTNRSAI